MVTIFYCTNFNPFRTTMKYPLFVLLLQCRAIQLLLSRRKQSKRSRTQSNAISLQCRRIFGERTLSTYIAKCLVLFSWLEEGWGETKISTKGVVDSREEGGRGEMIVCAVTRK